MGTVCNDFFMLNPRKPLLIVRFDTLRAREVDGFFRARLTRRFVVVRFLAIVLRPFVFRLFRGFISKISFMSLSLNTFFGHLYFTNDL